jgi:excisionase family DNA binding protein
MSVPVKINGITFDTPKQAAIVFGYSRDYVTRLAREGKISASQIGRQWYVNLDSLKNYAEVSHIEADIRKAHLSAKRKQEQLLHSVKEQHETNREKTAAAAQKKAFVATGSVLAVGLLAGVFGYSALMTQSSFDSAISQTTATNQYSQMAANAKTAMNTNASDTAVTRSDTNTESSAIETTESISQGILVLPLGANTDPAAVFSDEVRIYTATSGKQTAVLVDVNGVESDREIPFVLVPVKTDNI